MNDDQHHHPHSWLQTMLLGLLPSVVTVAVAWGAMSWRMTSAEGRAQEDRVAFSRSIEKLTTEIGLLRWELQQERVARLTDRADRLQMPAPTVPVFPRGRGFDK